MSDKLILVLNAGSTSFKYKLFNEQLKTIKEDNYTHLDGKTNSHLEVFRKILREIGDLTDIKIVGHRIVHGGGKFFQPTLIDDNNFQELKSFNHLAPLHNPYNLQILESSRVYLSHAPQLAVFDTAFFISLPFKAKIYALPLEYYEKHHLQRFGFHGISHQSAAEQAREKLKRKLNTLNLIICHLGGGCSVTAVKNGQAIDTSMGFTPMDGLVMMTRSGNIDPGIILYLHENFNMPFSEINYLLNNQSGIKGLFGNSDFKKLLKAVKRGNKKAKLAFDIFVYHVQKYIGAYAAILGKIDALVFTGAIGNGDPYTRKKICQLEMLRKIKILNFKADEEKVIAQECQKLLI
ncbi:MAG: acetate/propionate family kinase [Patescibacteria group bacterium]|jgi:acetate kinase|nr:acetate/propionate family kinase [Patescibacteria group bacterium]MDD5172663.1 acetate/propionate family kinase [Patescibacteria group bacterium]